MDALREEDVTSVMANMKRRALPPISQRGQRRRGCSREALPRCMQYRRYQRNPSAIGRSEITPLCLGEEPAGSRATPSLMAPDDRVCCYGAERSASAKGASCALAMSVTAQY